ncbi:MAG: sugar phosphate isomerase/epimerase [Ruminococcaceae bacterium]|nr:sugar phosphate isomerase/epimerase [Oscillospiraceae bacterium]
MYQFPIGVMLDSFRKPLDEALDCAVKVGAQGLQLYTVHGDFTPEALTPDKRRELLRKVQDHGLCFSALCGDLGHGFGNPDLNPDLIERSKRILDLAKELGTDVVTTHIGVVPSDPTHPRYAVMQDACGELARYADSMGSHFAIETGPEPSAVLKTFLDGLGSRGVGVNLDPANLVMVVADDPVEAVHNLKDYIVHTHAKDGVMIFQDNPEYIYGVTPRPENIEKETAFREVPLGEGNVGFPTYLKALEDIGYKGYLTIEREAGADPMKDIGDAVTFLKGIINQ